MLEDFTTALVKADYGGSLWLSNAYGCGSKVYRAHLKNRTLVKGKIDQNPIEDGEMGWYVGLVEGFLESSLNFLGGYFRVCFFPRDLFEKCGVS